LRLAEKDTQIKFIDTPLDFLKKDGMVAEDPKKLLNMLHERLE
jgi:hypothetical protein